MFGANSKIQAERSQRQLLEIANQPGNDVCADCKARAPRWTSHNLGIFICMNCASIHRKIGTHITKVKSMNLDTWTKEQVEHMKQNGNVKSNAFYNPDEIRHPPPTNMIDSERDSELEKFIRAKYEFKLFKKPVASPSFGRSSPLTSVKPVDRSAAVAALLGPSRSAASRPSPTPSSKTAPSSNAVPPPVPQKTIAQTNQAPSALALPSLVADSTRTLSRSFSQPAPTQQAQQQFQTGQSAGVWNELQSLQPKTIDATLPLQVASVQSPAAQPMAIPSSASYLSAPSPFGHLSVSPSTPFASTMSQGTGISPNSVGRSVSLGSGLNSNLVGSYQGGLSPFQPSPMATSLSLTPVNGAPSPNPFAPQAVPFAGAAISTAYNGMSGLSPSPQPGYAASPFGAAQQQQASQQFQQSLQLQTPMFQPQPQPQFLPSQLQAPIAVNPYAQMQPAGTPFAGVQQSYGGTPSPYAPMQPLPPMQQSQQSFGAANPFTSWIQQAPNQQQPWGM